MDLGAFSLSLTVRDIAASEHFYRALDFDVIDGGHINEAFPDSDAAKWRILQNGDTKLGLFQGMFAENVLTFNPLDVRAIQAHLKEAQVAIEKEVDETTEGPAVLMLRDPDGNSILLDQHS